VQRPALDVADRLAGGYRALGEPFRLAVGVTCERPTFGARDTER
jgi:hypothetical protein